MRFVMFYHSLVSDWNHGNAHFLRGVVTDLIEKGHEVHVYEPRDGWSLENLLRDHGRRPLKEFASAYPQLKSQFYDEEGLDLHHALDGADVVLVHEWNPPELVAAIGEHRQSSGDYVLFFHDTHHRAVTRPEDIANYDLSGYDGVLAFGQMIRDLYLQEGWAANAWTWHEAADVRRFQPLETDSCDGDLVWIGNWGDEERTTELFEFLLQPVRRLELSCNAYGVRYPQEARSQLKQAGIAYRGWLPNYRVPEVFARHRLTIHIPRRPYRESIPGVPTIRVFEALACGIPLVCVHWEDIENLFEPGQDFLLAQTGEEMADHLQSLMEDPQRAANIAEHGRKTILEKHTCGHRVEELLGILDSLKTDSPSDQEHPIRRRMTGAKS